MSEINLLERLVSSTQGRYFGKYRGRVVDNKDPKRLGRMRLRVPSVLGAETTDWASPCFPYGGKAGLGFYAVPPEGAQVFVEFVEGERNSPVWVGAVWPEDASPLKELSKDDPDVKIIRTDSGHVLLFCDEPDKETIRLTSKASAEVLLDADGSLTLTDSSGAKVMLDATEKTISISDSHGNSLTLTSDGILAKDKAGNEITAKGATVEVKAVGKVILNGPQVFVGGEGGQPVINGPNFLALFNAHVHTTTAPGSPTSPPVPSIVPSAVLSTKVFST